MTTPVAPSSLVRYLPAVYQKDPFLGRFLLAFEDVLIGRDDAAPGHEGLEQLIAGLATFFDPLQARDDFLPWLADWTAFTLRDDLEPRQRRNFLARIIQLYRLRGTKQNLQDLLAIFTVGTPTVTETAAADFELRSEEHTSELQSPCNLVCRLLLEKKKTKTLAPRGASSRMRWRSPSNAAPSCTTSKNTGARDARWSMKPAASYSRT